MKLEDHRKRLRGKLRHGEVVLDAIPASDHTAALATMSGTLFLTNERIVYLDKRTFRAVSIDKLSGVNKHTRTGAALLEFTGSGIELEVRVKGTVDRFLARLEHVRSTAASPPSEGRWAELQQIADLHERGVFNDEELAREKQRLMQGASTGITPDELTCPPFAQLASVARALEHGWLTPVEGEGARDEVLWGWNWAMVRMRGDVLEEGRRLIEHGLLQANELERIRSALNGSLVSDVTASEPAFEWKKILVVGVGALALAAFVLGTRKDKPQSRSTAPAKQRTRAVVPPQSEQSDKPPWEASEIAATKSRVNGSARAKSGHTFLTFSYRLTNRTSATITDPLIALVLVDHRGEEWKNRNQTGDASYEMPIGPGSSEHTWVTFEVPKSVIGKPMTLRTNAAQHGVEFEHVLLPGHVRE